ncbi:hypothetical protein NHX12_001099 [Muraenolepis orangiensis]|uniref:Uncharacterized protein n=1 Tax=Muraenolepis orangiensis TaxID=630683 RepID=A0A9Q0DZT8_9TELE|nr:hypothetical protein NHX12_001099 [Muraenolepis orangiensis]
MKPHGSQQTERDMMTFMMGNGPKNRGAKNPGVQGSGRCCCALVDDELRVDVVTARGFAWLELAHGLTEFLCCEFSREVGIDTGRS